MLQQYGFGPATCEVVPIHLDVEYTDDTKSKIATVKEVTQNNNQIVPETSNGSVYGNWKILIPLKVELDSEETVNLFNKHKTLFPFDHIRSLSVKQFDASVEFYRKNAVRDVRSDDPKFGEERYWFFRSNTDGRKVYAKDEKDLQQKLEDYVSKVREKKNNEKHRSKHRDQDMPMFRDQIAD